MTMALQVFSGLGIGLWLGLLVGLSASPVVAVLVGALASLLSALVLPGFGSGKEGGGKAPDGPAALARERGAALRSGTLGLAGVLGLGVGLWLRTHDSLSQPPRTPAERVAEWTAAGMARGQAVQLVALQTLGPASAAASGALRGDPALSGRTLLFGDANSTGPCEALAPARYASVAAAAQAYTAAQQPQWAALAEALQRRLPDEATRRAALGAAVEAACGAR